MDVLEVVSHVVNVAFLLLAVVGLRLWLRQRAASTAWAAAMFGAIGLVVAASYVWGEQAPRPVVAALVALLLGYPYLLFRFSDAMCPAAPVWRRAALIATVLVILPGLIIEPIDGPADTWPAPYAVWVSAALLVWATLGMAASWRLYRAGRGRSEVVRNRMRLLGCAALAMGLVIPLMVLVEEAAAGVAAQAVLSAVTVLAALFFLLAFVPPGPLRAAWRGRAERRLYEASVSLMAARRPEDVTEVLLPSVRDLMGARGVALFDRRGRLVAAEGQPVHRDGPDVETYALRDHDLVIATDPAVPIFGSEEETLLSRLQLLTDLAMDRTRLLQAEQEARRGLEAANAELETFIYTASHDLKNPLIAVLSYLELLQQEGAQTLTGEGRHYLDRVQANAEFMQALIRDLLDLSRIGRQELQQERVSVTDLLADLTREVQQAHPGFRAEIGPLPEVWINPIRVRQLFSNLLHNAAEHAGRDDVQVRVERQPDPRWLILRVSDNGRGIPDAYLERVFGIFERLEAEQSGDGTGMGLAICRRIVASLDGEMWAVPTDGGATFEIRLPAELEAARPTGARPHPKETPV